MQNKFQNKPDDTVYGWEMRSMYVHKKQIYRDYGGPICRHCWNELTRVHLVRKNCWYASHAGLCPRCLADNQNLVAKLKLTGIIRTIIGR